MSRRRSARGGVLLEVLVAIAVFVAAATVLLGLARDSIAALGRAEERELAVDLARDAMARLATGELSMADLRAGRVEPAETGRVDGDAPESSFASRFRVDARTQRTSYRGLVLVELSVFEAGGAVGATADQRVLCTLRQLVRPGRPTAEDDVGDDAPIEPEDGEAAP